MVPASQPYSPLSRAAGLLCLALAALLLDPRAQQARADAPATAPPCAAPRGSQAQVQLDVVVAQVRGRLARHFAEHFLKGSGPASTQKQDRTKPFVGVLDGPRDAHTFLAFLRTLQQENLAKLVAEPRLITLSGNPASFRSGGEVAIPGRGLVGVQFEEFGMRINFLPTAQQDDKVRLEVEPELSTVGSSAGLVVRSSRRIHTTAELKAGQTMLIGPAFKTEKRGEDEGELIILVTPHLVGHLSQAPPYVPPSPPSPLSRELAPQERVAAEPDSDVKPLP
jgi:Flp pilus assembly secretin CpaC